MRLRPAMSLLLVPALLSPLLPGCSSKNKGTNVVQIAEPFESGDLSNSGPSSIFVHTFPTAGSFSYRCRFHATMTGTVIASAGGADSADVSIVDFSFAPPSVTIKPGGLVTWVNNGPSVHTVTRP